MNSGFSYKKSVFAADDLLDFISHYFVSSLLNVIKTLRAKLMLFSLILVRRLGAVDHLININNLVD